MNFASVEYLLFFLIVFLIYWSLGSKGKNVQNAIIVISSLVFYGWWDYRFLGLLLLTVISTFVAGKCVHKSDRRTTQTIVLATTILLNIGVLAYFKYYNFFVESFVDAFTLFGVELSVSILKIILPIGISFYTFTALSYIIDVFKKKISATNDILAYSAYVMFFPSILCGPISRAQHQLPQYFEKRYFDYDKAVCGIRSVLLGAVMKLCLADRLGVYVDAVYANIGNHSGTTLLFASILYSVQIYADFAGYSMMAIGFGRFLGIDLPVNFRRPYFAKTVTEFWRRWHISLTTWFRDYIYFSLGGNRVGKFRWALNIMIVFIVSGLWHGAAYTFLIWGALHGLIMIIERFLYGDKLKHLADKLSIINILRMCLTFVLVTFVWIFFRLPSLPDAIAVITKIFINVGPLWYDTNTLMLAFIAFAIVACVDICEEFDLNIRLWRSKYPLVRYSIVVILISYIILFGVLNGGSFIYFQF